MPNEPTKTQKAQNSNVQQDDVSVSHSPNVGDSTPRPSKDGGVQDAQNLHVNDESQNKQTSVVQQDSATPIQQPGTSVPPVDEQAALDELAEKLAKWKSEMSDGSGNTKDQVIVQPDVETQRGPIAAQQDESVNVDEPTVQEVPQSKTISSGISVTPEDVKPVVDESAAVKQFEKEVQQAASVKSETYPKDIKKLLELAKERNASDVHITVGYPPIFRIDGKLVHIG
ncbi:MAG: hypothetical protein ABIC57_03810, partial [bacterium]